jgi:hypothetical protein
LKFFGIGLSFRRKVDGTWFIKSCQAFPVAVLDRITKSLERAELNG